MEKVVALTIQLDQFLPENLLVKAALDLLAYVPREDIIYFWGIDEWASMCDAYTRLPNLTTLHLTDMHLPAMFPAPNSIGDGGIPLSLQTLDLRDMTVDDDDWDLLTTFLSYRASSGKPLNTLKVTSSNHMCLKVVEDIKKVVREFLVEGTDPRCPFVVCPGSRLYR
jgi:hypothetical protein